MKLEKNYSKIKREKLLKIVAHDKRLLSTSTVCSNIDFAESNKGLNAFMRSFRPINNKHKRSFKVYSCYYCKESGNYIKLRKFKDAEAASKFYGIRKKSINFCIIWGSVPINGKLVGPRFKIPKDSISKETKGVSFFKFEDKAISNPLFCYELNGGFVGYFNNSASAADFLGVEGPEVKSSLEKKRGYLEIYRLRPLNLKSRPGTRLKIGYEWVVEDAGSNINGVPTIKSYITLKELLEEWNISKSAAYRSDLKGCSIRSGLVGERKKIKVFKRQI